MSFLTSRDQVAPQGIGKPVRRREDARLLTGAGRFADDVNLPGQAYACLVRSPHAHARIASIDVARAEGAPGVLAVLSGSDADKDGLEPIPHRPVPANPHEVPLKSRDGAPFFIAPHPVLAVAKVHYFGEPVAVVIADALPQAMDAAERVVVAYEPLPAVTRSEDALAPGAPLVWEERGTNLCVDSEAGDKAATDAAFARAAHVVRLETTINRVTGVPMELRAALGVHDAAEAKYTLYTSAGVASFGSATMSPLCLACPPPWSAWCRATSAAISASATAPARNSRSLPGRRDGSGVRSNGRANAMTRLPAISTAAT
jgi:aerobic carbon-monoxide dehydrogenase large subunit